MTISQGKISFWCCRFRLKRLFQVERRRTECHQHRGFFKHVTMIKNSALYQVSQASIAFNIHESLSKSANYQVSSFSYMVQGDDCTKSSTSSFNIPRKFNEQLMSRLHYCSPSSAAYRGSIRIGNKCTQCIIRTGIRHSFQCIGLQFPIIIKLISKKYHQLAFFIARVRYCRTIVVH